MILSGELKDFSLADVLQLLLQQRKSGVLNLSNAKEKAELFISGGNVNGVKVNGEMPEDKIKEMLVASGKVDKEGIQELQSISNEMNRPLLTTLVAKGYLTEEDKKEWLQIISEDMICELFGWTSGRYEFGTSLKAHATLSIHLNISTEFACMEGMRRIDEWPRLKDSLPNFRVVFRSLGKTYDGDALGWDFLVLGLVDGRKNVSQIAKQVPFGSFRLSECLVNLWDGGFIAPATESTEEQDVSAPADPQSEKDRKTAMVLGIALLFLVFAIMIRLVSFWMLGAGSSSDAKISNSGDFGVGVSQKMLRENVEALLIDYAAQNDNLPTDLRVLGKVGAFTSQELNRVLGDKPIYKKTSERNYQFK